MEVVHLYWSDLNFDLQTARVTAKPELGFYPKRWEQREVPIPVKLIELPKALRLLCSPCDTGNDVERTFASAVSWSPDGKFLHLNFRESVYAIPLRPGQMLSSIPTSRSQEDVAALPGARLIPQEGAFPGPDPSIYAFTKLAVHRNICRVSVP